MKKYYVAIGIIVSLITGFTSCSLFFGLDEPGAGVNALAFDRTELVMERGAMELLSLTTESRDLQGDMAVTWDYDPVYLLAETDNYGAVLTAVNPGETTVKAVVNGISVSCVVTITDSAYPAAVSEPYVYANAEYIAIRPGETQRIAASLYGGSNADINGFTFTIDKPGVAALITQGNYCWISGASEGVARISIRHERAAYPYTFLVDCRNDGKTIPYITTDTNIITINKSLDKNAVLAVDLQNAPSLSYKDRFAFALTGDTGAAHQNPPAVIDAANAECIISPRQTGECFITVTHPDAAYPLDVLVRVVDVVDTVYIEPSSSLVRVAGGGAEIVSVSLKNVPPDVSADTRDFVWTFPPEAAYFADYTIYNGSKIENGDTAWITAKKSGSFKIRVSHPLAAHSRDIIVAVKDLISEAAYSTTFISTSQNYVVTTAGADDTNIAIYVNNAENGDEADLHWHIINTASDGSSDPVITFTGGTGYSTSESAARNALSAIPMAFGNAVIKPVKEGRAVIVISHPKALYQTKILVSVISPAAAAEEEPFTLSADRAFLYLKNGENVILNARLNGPGKTLDDETAVTWSASSGNLSISPSGISAAVTAAGSGSSRETVTVNHPRAAYPALVTIVRYDSEAERDAYKILCTDTGYYTLYTGQTAVLNYILTNAESADVIQWEVLSGLNSVVSFHTDEYNLGRVTAAGPGTAQIKVSLLGSTEQIVYYVTVKQAGIINEALPCYLTTMHNVITLDPGQSTTVSVTPVNIAEFLYPDLVWTVSNPALVQVTANGQNAAVASQAGAGKAIITVSHPLAANRLEMSVHIGVPYEYKNNDLVYISTSKDTIETVAGAEDVPLQAVLTHTEAASQPAAAGFSFSINNSAVASLSSAQGAGACVISPRTAGQAIITVQHPDADFPKEVLLIVERPEGDKGAVPYLTTDTNVVTVMAGAYTNVSASVRNTPSLEPSSWNWVSADSSVAEVTAQTGSEILLRGAKPGTTSLLVSNSAAPNPLKIIVLCLDARTAAGEPWIKTNTGIMTLGLNASAAVTAEMVGGRETDNNAFIFKPSNTAQILVNGTGNTAYIKALAAGIGYITVSNSNYPDAYAKTVMVVVEDAARDDCYITVDKNIVKLNPQSNAGVTVKATLVNGEVTDPQDFVWWADDYNLVQLVSITDTASIMPSGIAGVTAVRVKHPKSVQEAEIIVSVSTFDRFSFGKNSYALSKGKMAYIPMEVPAAEGASIEYTSLNPSVCAITGSNRVAMISGVIEGSTAVTASLKNADGTVISRAEMPVIVHPVNPNTNEIAALNTIYRITPGESQTIRVSLSGKDIAPNDHLGIAWTSNNAHITFNNGKTTVTGNAAYITADKNVKTTEEVVLTLSHPKCDANLTLVVVITPRNTPEIILDKKEVTIKKDEGAFELTANIVNGRAEDYKALGWKVISGTSIVSITGMNGASCNIIPRNIGTARVAAQLPSGQIDDCTITVTASASLRLNYNSVKVIPGYPAKVTYETDPPDAQVNWAAQATGSDPTVLSGSVFTYEVNPTDKSITVNGTGVGNGVILGYLSGAGGGNTVKLNVTSDYSYEFSITSPSSVTLEPRGQSYPVTYSVFPYDLQVTAVSAEEDTVSVKQVSHNPAAGTGTVEIIPLQEKNANVTITLTATNPKDAVNAPLKRTVQIKPLYQNVTITPVFETMIQGSFSTVTTNGLSLGDGEEAYFYLDIAEKNAKLQDINVTWEPDPGTGTGDTSYNSITNSSNVSVTEEGEYSSGLRRWKIVHNHDETKNNYYKVTSFPGFKLVSLRKIPQSYIAMYTHSHTIKEHTNSNTYTTTSRGYKINQTYREIRSEGSNAYLYWNDVDADTMINSILNAARTNNSDIFDTLVNVREDVSASSSYEQGNHQTYADGSSTKTSLKLYNYNVYKNLVDFFNLPSFDINQVNIGITDSSTNFIWNNGKPSITINGQQTQLNSENTWQKTGTTNRSGDPVYGSVTWQESNYATWTQVKNNYAKPYYVEDGIFNAKAAFYQGGAGVSKFTSGGLQASRKTNVVHSRPGKLVIRYRLLKGTAGTIGASQRYYNVTVEVRECEAFTKGLYTQIQEGIYQ
jgi:hypothetical protein